MPAFSAKFERQIVAQQGRRLVEIHNEDIDITVVVEAPKAQPRLEWRAADQFGPAVGLIRKAAAETTNSDLRNSRPGIRAPRLSARILGNVVMRKGSPC